MEINPNSSILSIWSDSYHLSKINAHIYKRGSIDEEIMYIDMIARSKGWNPLQLNEMMEVHIAGKRYEIKRTL